MRIYRRKEQENCCRFCDKSTGPSKLPRPSEIVPSLEGRVRVQERLYKCGACDYSCKRQASLKLHAKVHDVKGSKASRSSENVSVIIPAMEVVVPNEIDATATEFREPGESQHNVSVAPAPSAMEVAPNIRDSTTQVRKPGRPPKYLKGIPGMKVVPSNDSTAKVRKPGRSRKNAAVTPAVEVAPDIDATKTEFWEPCDSLPNVAVAPPPMDVVPNNIDSTAQARKPGRPPKHLQGIPITGAVPSQVYTIKVRRPGRPPKIVPAVRAVPTMEVFVPSSSPTTDVQELKCVPVIIPAMEVDVPNSGSAVEVRKPGRPRKRPHTDVPGSVPTKVVRRGRPPKQTKVASKRFAEVPKLQVNKRIRKSTGRKYWRFNGRFLKKNPHKYIKTALKNRRKKQRKYQNSLKAIRRLKPLKLSIKKVLDGEQPVWVRSNSRFSTRLLSAKRRAVQTSPEISDKAPCPTRKKKGVRSEKPIEAKNGAIKYSGQNKLGEKPVFDRTKKWHTVKPLDFWSLLAPKTLLVCPECSLVFYNDSHASFEAHLHYHETLRELHSPKSISISDAEHAVTALDQAFYSRLMTTELETKSEESLGADNHPHPPTLIVKSAVDLNSNECPNFEAELFEKAEVPPDIKLFSHVETVGSSSVYECRVCSFMSSELWEMARHREVEHPAIRTSPEL